MQLIVYILVYPILWCISILPFRVLYLISDFLYLVIYRIGKYRVTTVKANLKMVFPDKSEQEINGITGKFYHFLCDMIMETIKSMTISKKELKKRFSYDNLDLIKDLETKNRSIVLLCGHYASWEWIFSLQLHVKYSGYAVYKQLSNKYFDRLVKRIRARHNSYLMTMNDTYKVMSGVQKRNEKAIYGFAADQSPMMGKNLYWNTFLGINVPMYTGAETLAKRFDLAVVFMNVNRYKRGFYKASFEVLTENPKKVDNYQLTDRYFELLEDQINKQPEFYLWTHKRWKHRDKAPKNLNN